MKFMNMKWISRAGVIVGICLVVTGCLKNEGEECEDKSEAELSAYITKNNISSQSKKESGLYYTEDTVGSGLTPKTGDYIVINYTGWYTDGTLIETTDSAMKSEWSAAEAYKYYVYGSAKIKYGYSRPGFNEGLSYMREGGWSTLVMPTELAYYNCRPVIYKINLISVIENPVEYEKELMVQYLAQSGMDTITSLYNGIYYKELRAASDTHSVELTDTVVIKFSGKYLFRSADASAIQTREFDSNLDDKDSLKFVYGINNIIHDGFILAIPEGFISALDTMRKGTRALVVIPYDKGFGETGLVESNYGYTVVPDYQTLVYDITMADIKPKVKK